MQKNLIVLATCFFANFNAIAEIHRYECKVADRQVFRDIYFDATIDSDSRTCETTFGTAINHKIPYLRWCANSLSAGALTFSDPFGAAKSQTTFAKDHFPDQIDFEVPLYTQLKCIKRAELPTASPRAFLRCPCHGESACQTETPDGVTVDVMSSGLDESTLVQIRDSRNLQQTAAYRLDLGTSSESTYEFVPFFKEWWHEGETKVTVSGDLVQAKIPSGKMDLRGFGEEATFRSYQCSWTQP